MKGCDVCEIALAQKENKAVRNPAAKTGIEVSWDIIGPLPEDVDGNT